MITTALAFALSLQAAGETAIAIRNDNPETWTVEYPRLIQPQVADYRGCLTFRILYVTGVPDFEAQHRSDLPRCEEVRQNAIAQSKSALSDAKTTLNDAEINALFNAIGQIHIQRGRDLDQQFAMRLDAAERAEAEGPPPRPAPLVIDLPNPSVVRSSQQTPAPPPPPQTPAISQ